MQNPMKLIREAVASGDLERLFDALAEIDAALTGAHAIPFGMASTGYENRRYLRRFLAELKDAKVKDPTVVLNLGDGASSRLLVFKDTKRGVIVAAPTGASTELVKAKWAKLTRGEEG